MKPAIPPASTILASLGQAAFVWDIATDEMAWSDHLASVFPDIPMEALANGAAFSNLIEPVRSVRTEALGHSSLAHGAEGVPYRIEYGVRASTSAPVLWIEESGCWFAAPTASRPASRALSVSTTSAMPATSNWSNCPGTIP